MNVYDILIILMLSITPGIESRGAFLYYAKLKLFSSSVNEPIVFIAILLASYIPSILILNLNRIENIIISKSSLLKKIYMKTLSRIRLKATGVTRYRSTYMGLTLFVAIPIPGTGVWTGSLIAYILGLDKTKSLISIFIGNTIACSILYIMIFSLSILI
ncbi:MAG: small multi-drug export protein [Desulfurococcaceae archaeon]